MTSSFFRRHHIVSSPLSHRHKIAIAESKATTLTVYRKNEYNLTFLRQLFQFVDKIGLSVQICQRELASNAMAELRFLSQVAFCHTERGFSTKIVSYYKTTTH
uniref:Uncharacterized protein n=1 Tax=Ceratitis capitata TaxID=7213 RepID=W8B0U6_CERCA